MLHLRVGVADHLYPLIGTAARRSPLPRERFSPLAQSRPSRQRCTSRFFSRSWWRGRGTEPKMSDNPMHRCNAAPRCSAKSKRTGMPCRSPAVRGYRVCRMHGRSWRCTGGEKERQFPAWLPHKRRHGGLALHQRACPSPSRYRLNRYTTVPTTSHRAFVLISARN